MFHDDHLKCDHLIIQSNATILRHSPRAGGVFYLSLNICNIIIRKIGVGFHSVHRAIIVTSFSTSPLFFNRIVIISSLS
jgi:hypothetical protein